MVVHILFPIWCFPCKNDLFVLSKHKLFIFVRKVLYEKFVRTLCYEDLSSFFKKLFCVMVILYCIILYLFCQFLMILFDIMQMFYRLFTLPFSRYSYSKFGSCISLCYDTLIKGFITHEQNYLRITRQFCAVSKFHLFKKRVILRIHTLSFLGIMFLISRKICNSNFVNINDHDHDFGIKQSYC